MITQERLLEIFEYKDGGLYWKIRPSNRVKVGDRFGALNKSDHYRAGAVKSEFYREHRLIYLYHHGVLPATLDHINQNREDNRIENLRGATRSENGQNRKDHKNNTSGIRNVHFYKRYNKWRVMLNINGKNKHFGYFLNFDEACSVAEQARIVYYKEFAVLNNEAVVIKRKLND